MKPAKLTVDLRMWRASGIGTYLQNLVPRLVKSMPDVRFCLLGSLREIADVFSAATNVSLIREESPIYSLREQWSLPRKIHSDSQCFWSPHYNIPRAYRGRLVVTIHDIFHMAQPHLVSGWHKRWYARNMMRAVCSRANQIICVSHFTKNEMRRLLAPAAPVRVIHNGVDESWFGLKKDQAPHPKPFLLFVGNVKPHKNLGSLLQAFERVRHEIPHDLLILGRKSGLLTADDQIERQAAHLDGRVIFTDFVDQARLGQYYAHAAALVFPSLYEGFGLPPLEAMACGLPTLVSDIPALREVCGDASLYCDARNPEDIAAKMLQLIRDEDLKNKLIREGRQRARGFSWEESAASTRQVIESQL